MRHFMRHLALALLLASSAVVLDALPVAGQTRLAEATRIGITFGGISTVGVTFEIFDGRQSLDLTVGTWSFRDLSVAAVVRNYFGSGDLLPFVGGGLWFATGRPSGERTGFALVLHAPVGIDWEAANRHSVGLALNLNRALWVRRSDPTDDQPSNGRVVPLPGLYYRWTHLPEEAIAVDGGP
jgi:hypothetical protein